mgnify:CR=1 FL=1
MTSTANERTLVLVKPDGVRRSLVGEIISRIEAKGYAIKALKMMNAERSTLEAHYAEHKGKPFYEPLMEFMLSVTKEQRLYKILCMAQIQRNRLSAR